MTQKGLDPALLSRLGLKTAAQLESGVNASPSEMPVTDCPVEDVQLPWYPKLTEAFRLLEVEGEREPLDAILAGKKLPPKWRSMSLTGKAEWMDANYPNIVARPVQEF